MASRSVVLGCMTMVMLVAAGLALRSSHAAAAGKSQPDPILVTAWISSCSIPSRAAAVIGSSSQSTAKPGKAAPAGLTTAAATTTMAAGSIREQAPALTSAEATLMVECGYSIQTSSSNKRQQLQQWPQQRLQQHMKVVGLDALTCHMHTREPEQQGQRYMFLLHKAGAAQGR